MNPTSTAAGWIPALLALALLGTGCPTVPPYPYWGPYETREGVLTAVEDHSDALHAYIDDWFDRGAPSGELLPAALYPEWVDPDLHDLRLVPEEDIDSTQQWSVREAQYGPQDFDDAVGLFPDPHATYHVLTPFIAPLGTKVIFEGEFPHARYFSIQPTPPFHPDGYRYDGGGVGEVAFVDADIDPLPGHVNPFRPGADRRATKRSYRVTCTVFLGDPTELDPAAWSPPEYRQAGNHRHCGTSIFRGPWGDPEWAEQHEGDGAGMIGHGEVWLRYYAPDDAKGPQAGVSPPKVTYELPDGRRFFLAADLSDFQARADRSGPLEEQAPQDQDSAGANGSGVGWFKQFDILGAIIDGIARDDWPDPNYARDLRIGVVGKGEALGSYMSLEPHNTASVHINYLLSGICLGAGKVFALSGKLPETPETRSGEPIMQTGEARYWSMTTYSSRADFDDPDWIPGQWITSVMDEEMVLNDENEYVLVYSRPQDRPANATAANGVTWIDFGPEACSGFTLRWLTIAPEWSFEKSPTTTNVGWEAVWSNANHDPSVIGENDRKGFLVEYQPIRSYLSRAEFEALGGPLRPEDLPAY